jgi:hypothetical protein
VQRVLLQVAVALAGSTQHALQLRYRHPAIAVVSAYSNISSRLLLFEKPPTVTIWPYAG